PARPLSYTPPAPGTESHPAAVMALGTAAAAFAFLAAGHRGPWPLRSAGREPATVFLTSASFALAVVASLSALFARSRRRRGVAGPAARAVVALYWLTFLSAAVFAGALK